MLACTLPGTGTFELLFVCARPHPWFRLLALVFRVELGTYRMQAEAEPSPRARLVRGTERFEGRRPDEQDAFTHAGHVQVWKSSWYDPPLRFDSPPLFSILACRVMRQFGVVTSACQRDDPPGVIVYLLLYPSVFTCPCTRVV